MNSYCVTFNTGFYGSWLVYFISQHRGFAPCEYRFRYNHFNNEKKIMSEKPIHMQLDGHEWIYEQRKEHIPEWTFYDDEDMNISLKNYILLHHDYEKFCYKATPHWHWDHMQDTFYRNTILAESRYIHIIFKENPKMIQDRLTKYSWDWVGSKDVVEYVDQCNMQAKTLSRLTDGLVIDLGRLLGKNEEDALDEYWKLLYYIEAPGLNNWQAHLAEVL